MEIITEGGKLPFDPVPSAPIRNFRNNPNLLQKPVEVWATVEEQLAEGAVVPFDVQGGYLKNGVTPMGGNLPFSSDPLMIAGHEFIAGGLV